MADQNTPVDKKLSVQSKTLTLKPRVETGTVRQSFPHGRTKQVVVEKRGKRRVGGEGAEQQDGDAAEARRKAEDERHRLEEEAKRKAETEAKKRFGEAEAAAAAPRPAAAAPVTAKAPTPSSRAPVPGARTPA